MHICFLIGHHIGEKGEQNHVVVDDLGQRTRSAGWSEAGPGRCQIAGRCVAVLQYIPPEMLCCGRRTKEGTLRASSAQSLLFPLTTEVLSLTSHGVCSLQVGGGEVYSTVLGRGLTHACMDTHTHAHTGDTYRDVH